MALLILAGILCRLRFGYIEELDVTAGEESNSDQQAASDEPLQMEMKIIKRQVCDCINRSKRCDVIRVNSVIKPVVTQYSMIP